MIDLELNFARLWNNTNKIKTLDNVNSKKNSINSTTFNSHCFKFYLAL